MTMLAQAGAELMVRALDALERGALQLTPQAADRRHLREQDRQDRNPHRLDAGRGSRSTTIAAGCRRFPARGANFGAGATGRVKVLRTTKGEGGASPAPRSTASLTIACGDGAVRLIELQRAGRQPMRAAEFLRGTPIGRESVLV